ncbi:TIGR02186 family protein [Pseudaminobacter soli (ex Li et al. 2025)]|uniref:TIGR02186 family protein n=1 Tax=Pseudaminobacter soli (ex Li et al. 2025) TaxID=1295366 RepID=A0A2P7SCQ8_9HYPH|nr:TIGR02186 family protein [Mesorhizobium soli]PSJ60302.1 TIGR02186 family protein [Mesorhizobium soli]
MRPVAALAAIALAWLSATPAPAVELPQETIQIGLSTDRIAITADFTGADLTIFGAIENSDPLLARQGRYDVIVALEGPTRPVVVRRKARVLGMWINVDSETFDNVPSSYSVATTRPWQDMADPEKYRQLSLGANNLHIAPVDTTESPATIAGFVAALRELKQKTGLYSERIGGVQFLSANLFRAKLLLAPDVPVGTHRARAFLFRNGVFIKETSAQLAIYKSGFEQAIYRFAMRHSLWFGIFAVVLAMITGWLGRIIFRKD